MASSLYEKRFPAYHCHMHEMSIAMSLLELAEAEARKNGCNRILRIKVECGELSGIMSASLLFCFDTLVENTPHKGAVLELVTVPLQLRCPSCGSLFNGASPGITLQCCPVCGEITGLDIEKGRELLLLQLEAIDDPDPTLCQR